MDSRRPHCYNARGLSARLRCEIKSMQSNDNPRSHSTSRRLGFTADLAGVYTPDYQHGATLYARISEQTVACAVRRGVERGSEIR